MPLYTTEYVKNLSTGKPFTLCVTGTSLERLECQKGCLAATGKTPLGTRVEGLVRTYEFSFFASYHEVLKIFWDTGFTPELLTQILQEFGVKETFIEKLLEDEEYISKARPLFKGITCDGERAADTMKAVYDLTKGYYSL
ncbi:MAG: hypothetical protein V4697_01820 [Patescibacteria group bacterium]